MREAIMRLSKRKRKQDVNKDLFDALLERNCMLRFTHYLHKLDTTELFREQNGTSTVETNRICDDYLDSLNLSSLTHTLLQERMLATPFIFLLAQSEVWEHLNNVLFPQFRETKGLKNSISSMKMKRVYESDPKTVKLLDQYIQLRLSKDPSLVNISIKPETPRSLGLKGVSSKSSLPKGSHKANGSLSAPVTPSNTASGLIVTSTSSRLDSSSKSSAKVCVTPRSKQKHSGASDVTTASATSESLKGVKPPIHFRQSSGSNSSRKRNTKNSDRVGTDEGLPSSPPSVARPSVAMITPTPSVLEEFLVLERKGGAAPTSTFPDLSAGRLGKLNLPTFSSMWLDFGLYLAFRDYLGTIFSQESLAFYVKSEHYRLVLDKDDRPDAMREIYSYYIGKSVVHVTSRQSQKIRSQFANSPPDIFREVTLQMHDLLRFQWIDFVFSPHFDSLTAGTIKIKAKLGRRPTSSVNCFLELRDYFINALNGNPTTKSSIIKTSNSASTVNANSNLKPSVRTNRESQTSSISSSAALTSTTISIFSSSSTVPSTTQSLSSNSRKRDMIEREKGREKEINEESNEDTARQKHLKQNTHSHSDTRRRHKSSKPKRRSNTTTTTTTTTTTSARHSVSSSKRRSSASSDTDKQNSSPRSQMKIPVRSLKEGENFTYNHRYKKMAGSSSPHRYSGQPFAVNPTRTAPTTPTSEKSETTGNNSDDKTTTIAPRASRQKIETSTDKVIINLPSRLSGALQPAYPDRGSTW